MSDIDTLEMIKRRESDADSAISKAESDYHKEVDAAKREAERIIERARIRSEAEYKRIILDYNREAQAKLDELASESDHLLKGIKRIQKREIMAAFERSVRKVFGV